MSENSRPGIGIAGIAAIVVVGGYIAFELHALYRAQERMEPASILDDFVGAHRAMALCGDSPPQRAAFERNFNAVIALAAADYAEQRASGAEGTPPKTMAERRAQRAAEVDALVADQGCDGADVRRLLKLYEVRARLNLR